MAMTRRLTDSEQRLDQFRAALAHGADPAVVNTWINQAQADLARARTDLALLNNEVPTEISRADSPQSSATCPCWSAACRRHRGDQVRALRRPRGTRRLPP
ncbi:MAG: Recombinase zinc beta ribbon protein [Modestobacter sp.]|jgi:hypothetical protein|nr:Recombinase zinc beta ribbon protein [Modestobacter sp.]